MSFAKFFYGKLDNMELSALRWWNSKRLEYSVRFLICLIIAQLLFLLTAFSLGGIDTSNILQRLMSAFFWDLVLLLLINVVYFLWPCLEVVLFKKINIVYRKNCFAFLNVLNVLIVISAFVLVIASKT